MAGNANLYMAAGKAGYDTAYAFGSTIGQYSVNRTLASMNANTYRTQARLALLNADKQSAYINEQAAHQVWNTYDTASRLRGSQVAAMGASGFDVSSGDRRLLQDTENRANAQAAGINRTAYLQSFETQLQAAMEASRLEYAAKAQDAIRKQSSSGKAFLGATFAALGAFAGNVGTLSAAGAFSGPSRDVTPVKTNQFTTNSNITSVNDKLSLGYGKQTLMGWGGF